MSGCSAKRNDVIQFIVPGPPIGKSYRQGGGKMFLAPKARQYQDRIGMFAFLARHELGWRPSNDVRAFLIFEFATKDKRKIGKIKTTKPDADNLIKSCLDGLRPLIGDDSKVTPRILRRWGEESRTIIRLKNM